MGSTQLTTYRRPAGNQSAISTDVREAFRLTGTSHIIVISGDVLTMFF